MRDDFDDDEELQEEEQVGLLDETDDSEEEETEEEKPQAKGGQSYLAWLQNLRSSYPVLTAEDEAELVRKYADDKDYLRSEFMLHNLCPAIVFVRKSIGKYFETETLISTVTQGLAQSFDRHFNELGKGIPFLSIVKDELLEQADLDRKEDAKYACGFTRLDSPINFRKNNSTDEKTGLDSVVCRVDPVFLDRRDGIDHDSGKTLLVDHVKQLLERDPADPGARLFKTMYIENLTFDAAVSKLGIDPDQAEELLEQTANILKSELHNELGIDGEEDLD